MKSSIFEIIISALLVILSLISIIWFTFYDIELTKGHFWTLLILNLVLTISLLLKDIVNYVLRKEKRDGDDLEW